MWRTNEFSSTIASSSSSSTSSLPPERRRREKDEEKGRGASRKRRRQENDEEVKENDEEVGDFCCYSLGASKEEKGEEVAELYKNAEATEELKVTTKPKKGREL